MRFWAVFWLLVAAAIATFTLVNWEVLTARTEMNLVFAQFIAPLGLVMLGGMAGIAILFLFFLVWLETKALVQMGPARKAAAGDPIAATELRTEVERRLNDMQADVHETLRNVVTRVDYLEGVVRRDGGSHPSAPSPRVEALDPDLRRPH